MKVGPCTAAAEEGVSKQKLTHASVTVPHKGHAEAKDKCKGLVPPMHSPPTHKGCWALPWETWPCSHWEGTQQCHSCDDGAVRVTNVWWIVWLSCNSSHIWLTASLPPAQCPSCAQLCQSTPRTLQTAIATSKYRHGTFFCNLLSLPSFQSFPIHQQRMSCCVFLKSQERVNLDSLRDRLRMRTCTVLQGKGEKVFSGSHKIGLLS